MTLYRETEDYVGRYYLALHDRYTQIIVGESEPVLCGQLEPYIAPQMLKVHGPPFRQKVLLQRWHEGEQLFLNTNLVFVSNRRDEVFLTAWDVDNAFEHWTDALKHKLAMEEELQCEWLKRHPNKKEAFDKRKAELAETRVAHVDTTYHAGLLPAKTSPKILTKTVSKTSVTTSVKTPVKTTLVGFHPFTPRPVKP